MSRLPTVSDRAFALDAATILAASVAIITSADRLLLMSLLVPALLLTRHVTWSRLPLAERGHSGGVEAVFILACTLLGAFNDWNSVVNHRIYDYGVPVYFPEWSTIPGWMLLFWGMILRFFYTLARWQRLRPPDAFAETLWPLRRPAPALRVALLLGLTLVTRQSIYRLWADPIGSWLPFALALGVYVVACRPRRHAWWLLGLALTMGPLIEIAYIQLAGLHRYHLGWLGGVPLWIALWWGLALLVWQELVGRAMAAWPVAGRLSRPWCHSNANREPGPGR